jgi:tetratricopeptide (TPR) repeat protein
MKTFIFLLTISLSMLHAGTEIPALIARGDSCFKALDNPGALKAYQEAVGLDSLNYESNWKLSRAFVDIGETMEGDERAEYFKQAEKYAQKAVTIDSTGSKGHLQLAVALGRVALDAGAKERVQMSKEIKRQVDLAIKYNPKDDIAYHVLGRWNRKLANLSWIETTFANMFLGGIPDEASDENAVKCFKKAIELNPNHINHHLELGITYEMMGRDEEARKEYQICLDLPDSDSADEAHKAEAKRRLEDL